MTSYEWFRWITFPLMTVHLQTVRQHIKYLVKKSSSFQKTIKILDVGGRKSPYTIGVPASVTLLDVPQESGVKADLQLGFTTSILETIKKKRSNITDVVIEDMTKSTLPDASYDAVVSIEVIEHVPEDEMFIKNIAKVIKPGGWVYLTTPNGDFIKNEGPNKNPDHVRHYTKAQLETLLKRYFDQVTVSYAVKTGKYRVWSLKSLKTKNIISITKTLLGTLVNKYQSKAMKNQAHGTAHLVAIAYRKK